MPLRLRDEILATPHRLAMPILTYPGAALVGCTARDMVTDAAAQVAAQLALHERFGTAVLLSAMDLTVEAEAFGAAVTLSDWEAPALARRLVHDGAEAARLGVPAVGAGRTPVYIEAVRRLAAQSGGRPVLAGMTGPFTVAARLFGVTETLMETIDHPEVIHALVDATTAFLVEYARAFREAGARGVIVAEPVAGLVSPNAIREFSTPCFRRLIEAVGHDGFEVIVHNCGARLAHLPAILEAGAGIYHFGQPMDLAAALGQVPAGVVVCGNLDPSGVFVAGTPGEVRDRTRDLLRAIPRDCRQLVVSSGCDLPARTPLANVQAFLDVVQEFNSAPGR